MQLDPTTVEMMSITIYVYNHYFSSFIHNREPGKERNTTKITLYVG